MNNNMTELEKLTWLIAREFVAAFEDMLKPEEDDEFFEQGLPIAVAANAA
jgi:hypothetical protein